MKTVLVLLVVLAMAGCSREYFEGDYRVVDLYIQNRAFSSGHMRVQNVKDPTERIFFGGNFVSALEGDVLHIKWYHEKVSGLDEVTEYWVVKSARE